MSTSSSFTPDITTPDITMPDITMPDITTPDITTPDITPTTTVGGPGATGTTSGTAAARVATAIGDTTSITEIAPDIFRITTYVPDIAAPAGFSFNQFLVRGDEPFLMHTGMRGIFPSVVEAVDRLVGVDRLRWVSFGHVEADECGAMNMFLDAAPHAQVVHGQLGVSISLNDLCDRPPVAVSDEALDIGGHLMRFIPTPHVPHNWESGIWYDESTSTLLAGDLFTALGAGPALVESDLVEGALVAEHLFHHSSLGAHIPATIRSLADLAPRTLACMHGPSFHGDGGAQLAALAAAYDALI